MPDVKTYAELVVENWERDAKEHPGLTEWDNVKLAREYLRLVSAANRAAELERATANLIEVLQLARKYADLNQPYFGVSQNEMFARIDAAIDAASNLQ